MIPGAPAATHRSPPGVGHGSVERRGAAVLLLAAAIALLAWIGVHASQHGPSFDGAMNLQVAWSLSEGEGFRRTYAGREPFPHEIQTNAPYLVVAALAFKAFGVGLWQAQLANLLYLQALVALAFWVVHRRFGLLPGALAALLVACTPGLITFGLDGYGEVPALAWCIAALALFPWAQRQRADRLVALAGVCLGMAVATKAVMAIGAASFGLCFVLALAADRARSPGLRVRALALLALGFVLPLLAFEAWRWLELGSLAAYRAWWAFQLGAIGQEAGLKPETIDRATSSARNLAQLSAWYGLPPKAVLAWLLGPYLLAIVLLLRTRDLRRNGALLCLLLAAGIYFYWWLYVTPPPKAWHRRILDGSLLLNLAWVHVAAQLAEAMASARRGWLRSLSVAPLVAIAFLAVVFFNANARPLLTAPPGDLGNFRRATAILRALPPDVQVYALGWHAASSLSLLAERPFADFNDTVIARLDRRRPAILALDTSALGAKAHLPVIETYASERLLPEGSNPQLYRVHFDRPKPFAAAAVAPDPVVDLTKNDYQAVRGFYGAEGNGTRWMTSEGLVALRYDGSPLLAFEAYAPRATYARGDAINVAVALDHCVVGSAAVPRGGKVTVRLPVPAQCGLQPGQAVTARLSADNLIANPITRDDRRLSVVVGKVGFVPACSGNRCPDWPRVRKPKAAAAAPAPTMPASTPAEAGSGASAAVAAGATLAAHPNPVDPCGRAARPTVEVSWTLPAGVAGGQLWVSAPGVARKLWHATGAGRGTRTTGPWIADRTEFVLTDPQGRQLAATTVRLRPCAD